MEAKSWESLRDRILEASDEFAPGLEPEFRPMFGGACAYARKRVFATLSHAGIALKLPPAAQEELLRVAGAKRLQYAADDPPSKQYIVVPPEVAEQPDLLAGWIRRSVEYVAVLPPPRPRSARRRSCR